MANTSIELFGKTLKNPVMNASGTLGYGKEIEPLWPVETMGAYVTKGLSLEPHHGNPLPRIWDQQYGMINSIGLQNVGVERFFGHYFPFFRSRRIPIIVNFFGFSDDEYIRCAERIKPHELIVALEMNLSCPNVKKGGISFGKDPEMVYAIVKRVKEATSIPVIAKLTPEVKNIGEIASAAHEGGADGFTLLNTMPAAVVDVSQMRMPLRGGLSGPVMRPIALRAVFEISKAVPVPVIGAGGIMDSTDALAFLMAGAKAVQVGTATFVDPYAIPKIVEGIGEYLTRQKCANLDPIIGCTHREDSGSR
ncbi:MAG TPA: dihydroorotate dehydrogenase [Syntrophorhabdaceae bacterium]|jgi:dihydroorotate dehydrogenase (NAD+) catalytic subunit